MHGRTTIYLLLAVLLLGGFLWYVEKDQFTTSEKQERARKALWVDVDRVSLVQFTDGDNEVRVEKKNERWLLTQPVKGPADAGEVERLLWQMRELPRLSVITADEQKREGWSLQQYGLEHPVASISLGYEDASRTLLIGRKVATGQGFYVKYEDQPDVVVTGPEVLELMPDAVDQLRERNLFRMNRLDVDKVEVQRREGFLQLTRQEGAWRILQPLSARADRQTVEDFIERLLAHHIEQFIKEDAVEMAAYGLDGGTSISLRDETTGASQTLRLGLPVTENDLLVYGKHESYETLYGIPTNILSDLLVDAETFRDKRLVKLAAYEVKHFSVQEGEQTIEVERDNRGWLLRQPTERRADTAHISELLQAWEEVRAIGFTDGKETNRTAAGFVPPLRTITFSREPPSKDLLPDDTIVFTAQNKGGFGLALAGGETALVKVKKNLAALAPLDPLFYWDRNVYDLGAEQIRAFKIKTPDSMQEIQREGGAWVAPLLEHAAMDEDAVADLLELARRLEVEAYVEASPTALASYGLDNPWGHLTLGLTGEKGIEKTLWLGAADGNGSVYGMLQGSEVVFTLPDAWRELLRRPLYKDLSRDTE